MAALAWPLWENPVLLQHYWVALTQRTQTHSHLSPLLGTALRLVFGLDKFWLQFVPTAACNRSLAGRLRQNAIVWPR